jgi:hypothetical protein
MDRHLNAGYRYGFVFILALRHMAHRNQVLFTKSGKIFIILYRYGFVTILALRHLTHRNQVLFTKSGKIFIIFEIISHYVIMSYHRYTVQQVH